MSLFITIDKDNAIITSGQTDTTMVATATTIIGIRPNTFDTHYNSKTNTTYESESSYAARQINKRNVYLTQSDYTQIADATFVGTLDEWKAYRQQLRDITSNSNWPYLDTEDWPTKPS
jgi:hypothetical protein